MKIFSIAVDGPSGAGKSSISKAIAKKYGIIYVDTGAIYRAVGLHVFNNGVDPKDGEAVEKLLPGISIELAYLGGEQHVFLNGEDINGKIRTETASKYASDVSAIPAVRDFLLGIQRQFAETQSVILDGRDIGTVVLPNADIKFFLTATPEERARRRFLEQQARGIEVTLPEVLENINERDYNDTHRAVAPLKQADDAVLVDSTHINFDETFKVMCDIIDKEISSCSR